VAGKERIKEKIRNSGWAGATSLQNPETLGGAGEDANDLQAPSLGSSRECRKNEGGSWGFEMGWTKRMGGGGAGGGVEGSSFKGRVHNPPGTEQGGIVRGKTYG